MWACWRCGYDAVLYSCTIPHHSPIASGKFVFYVLARDLTLWQALRKKTLAGTSDIHDDAAWGEVACLVRLAWAASYNPRDSIQNQLFIPETAHVVTMVAAAGPLAMRQAVHGLFMNLLHVLSINRNPDDPRTAELHGIVADAASPSIAQLFGLSLSHSSKTYTLANDSSQHLDVSVVEEISKLLLRVIELGAGTPGRVVFSILPIHFIECLLHRFRKCDQG
jgi:hypothetical protein